MIAQRPCKRNKLRFKSLGLFFCGTRSEAQDEIENFRHAFVTGGASGIGLGVAEALADRGISVSLADVDADAAARAEASRPDSFFAMSLDVRDRAAWRACHDAAEGRFGPIDILVNNAGVSFDGLEIVDTPPESFEQGWRST